MEYDCHSTNFCPEIDPIEAALKIKQTSKSIVTLLAFACDSSVLAICYIPHSGIVNKISDYVKICQRLTNLPCNVGGIREDKIAWGTWLKLQNKYPKIDCCVKAGVM